MNRREKIVKLHECMNSQRYSELLLDDIKRWRDYQKRVTAAADSMPGKNRRGKVESAEVEIDELCEKIAVEAEKAAKKYTDAVELFNGLEDARQREIMHRRFLKKQSFNKIAVEMNYSIERIFQLYRQALDKIEV